MDTESVSFDFWPIYFGASGRSVDDDVIKIQNGIVERTFPDIKRDEGSVLVALRQNTAAGEFDDFVGENAVAGSADAERVAFPDGDFDNVLPDPRTSAG